MSSDPSSPLELPVTVIEPRPGWQVLNLKELWRFRELLFFLTWRDIKVRYKQTVLGIGWVFFQPLAAMLVFVLFLGKMGGISANVPNYGFFVFTGMLVWTFFANAVMSAGNSIIANERLVTKVYFPRLLVPLSAVGAALFDFVIGLLLLIGMMIWYDITPQLNLLLAPLIFLMLVAAAIGFGSLLAALIVVQRDFRYVLHFGVQLWMFATPAIYLSPEMLGPTAREWLPLNPAHGLILNFREALIGGELNWYSLGVSSAVALGVLVLGAAFFRRTERHFADVI